MDGRNECYSTRVKSKKLRLRDLVMPNPSLIYEISGRNKQEFSGQLG